MLEFTYSCILNLYKYCRESIDLTRATWRATESDAQFRKPKSEVQGDQNSEVQSPGGVKTLKSEVQGGQKPWCMYTCSPMSQVQSPRGHAREGLFSILEFLIDVR